MTGILSSCHVACFPSCAHFRFELQRCLGFQVGALEEAQLAVHRQRAAEALAKQEALAKHGGHTASGAAAPAETVGKKEK